MQDDDPIIDDDLAIETVGYVDSLLYRAFQKIRLLEPSNRVRLMAHIEDRVREEVADYISKYVMPGSTEGSK